MFFYYDSLSEPCELYGIRVDTKLLRHAVVGRDKDCQVDNAAACFNASEFESDLYNTCLPERPAHRFLQLRSIADMELWLSYGGYELSDARSVKHFEI